MDCELLRTEIRIIRGSCSYILILAYTVLQQNPHKRKLSDRYEIIYV